MKWNTKERIAKLKALYAEIDRRQSDICDALYSDLHKNAGEAYSTEIGIVLAEISKLTRHLKRWTSTKSYMMPLFLPFYRGKVVREPWGEVLVIAPWNYPFQLLMSPLVAAFAAGNSVVAKASPLAPATERVMGEILSTIFPAEQVEMKYGGVDVVTKLLAQKWDFIFFTGSSPTGRIIARAAAEHLTPVVLELGGKSPCIISSSANLELAARRVTWGKFNNAGQTCVAPDYVLADATIADDFERLVRKNIEQMYGIEPIDSPLYGRMVTQNAFDRVIAMHPQAICDREQKYIAPTVVRLPHSDSELMVAEIFGPVLPIITYNKLVEATDYINSTDKPLALYFFGDAKIATQVVKTCNSGGVCINDVMVHLVSEKLPFGGVGASGMGCYHGRWSINTFTRARAVVYASNLMDVKFRYNPLKYIKLIKTSLK